MGFYVKKSVSVGPFRFNLSKSGVGVSAGIPGLRLGTGPRGNYVHMGRGGLYYRKTFPSGTEQTEITPDKLEMQESHKDLGHDRLTEIESGDLAQMVDSSSANLVAEMNEKRMKMRVWPVIAIFGLVALFLTSKHFQSETPAIALAVIGP